MPSGAWALLRSGAGVCILSAGTAPILLPSPTRGEGRKTQQPSRHAMSSAELSATQNLSPTKFLTQMLTGYWISQALYVAAKLGLPDLLESGVKRPEDLARATGTHPPSLYRLLRALASVGVFSERPDGSFTQTPLS